MSSARSAHAKDDQSGRSHVNSKFREERTQGCTYPSKRVPVVRKMGMSWPRSCHDGSPEPSGVGCNPSSDAAIRSNDSSRETKGLPEDKGSSVRSMKTEKESKGGGGG